MNVLGLAIPPWVRIAFHAAPYVAIVVLVFMLTASRAQVDHWKSQFAIEKGQFALLAEGYRTKVAEARAADLKHVQLVAASDSQARKDIENAYSAKLADARTRLAAYVDRVRAASVETDPRRIGGADLSRASGGAHDLDGSDPLTVVSVADLDTCTENTVRLQSVQAWWRNRTTSPR